MQQNLDLELDYKLRTRFLDLRVGHRETPVGRPALRARLEWEIPNHLEREERH